MKHQPKPCDIRGVISDGKLVVTEELYFGLVRARKAKQWCEQQGIPYRWIPHANGCRGMYGRTDCVITRPPSAAEILQHRHLEIQKQNEVQYRSQFTEEQLAWLDKHQYNHKNRCFGMLWFPARRPKPNAEEVAMLMGLTNKNAFGWGVYSDWLEDRGEVELAHKIRYHIHKEQQ